MCSDCCHEIVALSIECSKNYAQKHQDPKSLQTEMDASKNEGRDCDSDPQGHESGEWWHEKSPEDELQGPHKRLQGSAVCKRCKVFKHHQIAKSDCLQGQLLRLHVCGMMCEGVNLKLPLPKLEHKSSAQGSTAHLSPAANWNIWGSLLTVRNWSFWDAFPKDCMKAAA